jgi:putative methionine-R-sulfoxide reductase with GAF domain
MFAKRFAHFKPKERLFAIAVYVVDGEHAVRVSAEGAQCGKCDRLHLFTGNIGMVARTSRTHSTADVSADPTYTSCFAEVRAETVVPVLSTGRVVGVIDAESSGGAAIDPSVLATRAQPSWWSAKSRS